MWNRRDNASVVAGFSRSDATGSAKSGLDMTSCEGDELCRRWLCASLPRTMPEHGLPSFLTAPRYLMTQVHPVTLSSPTRNKPLSKIQNQFLRVVDRCVLSICLRTVGGVSNLHVSLHTNTPAVCAPNIVRSRLTSEARDEKNLCADADGRVSRQHTEWLHCCA